MIFGTAESEVSIRFVNLLNNSSFSLSEMLETDNEPKEMISGKDSSKKPVDLVK